MLGYTLAIDNHHNRHIYTYYCLGAGGDLRVYIKSRYELRRPIFNYEITVWVLPFM